jgi:hypothetical protein
VKVTDTVFRNVYWVLLVVFTPQFNNKCRELYRNSRRLFGKRPGRWSQEFIFCMTMRNLTMRTQLSLDLLGLGYSSTSTTQSWFALSDFHIFSNMEKHLRGQHFNSNEDIHKWSQDSYVPRTYLFPWRTRLIDILLTQVSKQTWWLWNSKDYMRLYPSPMSYYVILLK